MVEDLIQSMFGQYYDENAKEIIPPTSIDRREFAVLLFQDRTMVRHKALTTPENLRQFIISMAPSDVYFSSAYYEYPEEVMGKKGWLGADLVFDIDYDHIETPCGNAHDYWICENCWNTGMGVKPDVCPKCRGIKLKTETWLCEKCLNAAKAETQKLLDFITVDFGFRSEDIVTCFSGQRGYHVHIEHPSVRILDQNARREIVDYVTGNGLKVDLHGLFETRDARRRIIVRPNLNDPGWDGRMMRGMYDLLVASTSDAIDELNLSKEASNLLKRNKELLLESLTSESPWMSLKGLGSKPLAKLIQMGIARQASAVDTVVTTDIHRLIRLPQTLHGKTGLKSMEIPTDALAKFNPLVDAVAFKEGTLKVLVQEAYQFRIGRQVYGPYHEETVELPTSAAIYLLCKRVATPA